MDSVLVDGGRGEQPTSFCEQQQVAGVCEKATAPVVIYTYRRAIGQGHNSCTWGLGHNNGSM